MKKCFRFLVLSVLIIFIFTFWGKKTFFYIMSRKYGKVEERIYTLFGEFIADGVAFVDDYVYVCAFSSLLVFDAKNPLALKLIKKIPLPLMYLAKEGSTLFAASVTGSLYLIDTLSPSNPKITGKLTRLGEILTINGIAVKNDFVYLITDRGLFVVDARDKKHPHIIKKIHAGLLWGIFIYKEKLYTLKERKGLAIFDIKQPAEPILLGELHLYKSIKGKPLPNDIPPTEVAVVSHYAYVANGYHGVAIINVKNPAKPSLIRHVRTGKYCEGITAVGKVLAVRTLPDTVMFLSLKNPRAPTVEKTIRGIGFRSSGILHNNAIFVKNWYTFSIVDIHNPLSLKTIGSYSMKPVATGIKTDNKYVYLIERGRGLTIYRRSPPENPKRVGFKPIDDIVYDIVILKKHAFISTVLSGINIVDMRQRDKPALKTVFDFEQMTWGIALEKGILYSASMDRGLTLYNVKNMDKPSFLTSIENFKQENPPIVSIAVKNSYAYLGDIIGSFYVADIANTEKIRLLKEVNAVALDVAVKDKIAYLAGYKKGIQVVDVHVPEEAALIDNFSTGGEVVKLDIRENRLFAADFKKGIFVFDITDPRHLKKIAHYTTKGHPRDISAVGNFLYVADGEAGLTVINLATGQVL